MPNAKKATKAATDKSYDGFTADERSAMKERAKELKAEAARSGKKEAEEAAQNEKIAELEEADRVMAEKLQELVKANAPTLSSKLWYGMPGWAKDGKIVCFFQPAAKFKTRYATLGFNDPAALDDGNLWPTAFALTKLTAADEKKIATLVKRAVS